jgi:hypothetical protein
LSKHNHREHRENIMFNEVDRILLPENKNKYWEFRKSPR